MEWGGAMWNSNVGALNVAWKLKIFASGPQWGHHEMSSKRSAQLGCLTARVRPSLGHSMARKNGGHHPIVMVIGNQKTWTLGELQYTYDKELGCKYARVTIFFQILMHVVSNKAWI